MRFPFACNPPPTMALEGLGLGALGCLCCPLQTFHLISGVFEGCRAPRGCGEGGDQAGHGPAPLSFATSEGCSPAALRQANTREVNSVPLVISLTVFSLNLTGFTVNLKSGVLSCLHTSHQMLGTVFFHPFLALGVCKVLHRSHFSSTTLPLSRARVLGQALCSSPGSAAEQPLHWGILPTGKALCPPSANAGLGGINDEIPAPGNCCHCASPAHNSEGCGCWLFRRI